MDKLLKGGTIVTANRMFKSDLLIKGEKIFQIAESISSEDLESEHQIIDVTNKLIMPGIIDAHTHYQLESRNTTTADNFYTGSVSAAAGGVTTFIDYSDHYLNRSLKEAAQERIDQALGKTVLDFSLHQDIVYFNEQVSSEIAELRDLGIASIKIFTTYRREGYMIPKEDWEQLFQRLKEVEVLVTVHAEDDDLIMRLEEEYLEKGLTSPAMHPKIRPSEAEGIAVFTVGEIARKVGIPIFIAHLSSKAGYDALKRVKAAGGSIYAETTPHYLLLADDKLSEPDAQKFVMTPPLRTEIDQEALWEGLKTGDIQSIATDHCSFTLEQKLSDDSCLTILPGLPGSETLLPLIHHFGRQKNLIDYPQLVKMLSTTPAKIFGLYPEKGSLAPGTDADLVIFDPEKRVMLEDDILHSQAGYTPFAGIEVTGYPVMTFLRGNLLMKDGEFVGDVGGGRFVKGNRSSLFTEK